MQYIWGPSPNLIEEALRIKKVTIMLRHADKAPENKTRSVANASVLKNSKDVLPFQRADMRPKAVAQRRWQEMADNHPKTSPSGTGLESVDKQQQIAQTGLVNKIDKNLEALPPALKANLRKNTRLPANNNGLVAQRHIMHDPDALGAEVYTTGYDDGNKITVDDFVEAVVLKEPSLKAHKDTIKQIMKVYEGESEAGDFAYNTIEEAIEWLYGNGLDREANTTSSQEEFSEEESSEKQVDGQTVGKLWFPGRTYHDDVKKRIIQQIGAKKLSFLVYGEKGYTNFNFWFEKDGRIFAEQNSDRNSKGKYTGYIWNGKDAVEA